MSALQNSLLMLNATAAVADLVAIIVVLLGANDRRIARSFVLLGSSLFIWSLYLVLERLPHAAEHHPTLLWALSLGFISLPATVLQNAVAWSEHKSRGVLRMVCASTFVLTVAQLLGSWVIAGFRNASWGVVGYPGALFPVYVVLVATAFAASLAACWNAVARPTDAKVRLRVKYWLLASAAAFPLGFTNVATNYGLPIPPLGCVGHLVLVAIVTYAAAKHRLMDVDVFVMRAAATLLAGVAVVLPVAGGLIWMHHLRSGASGLLVAGCLVLAALVSLLMFWRFRSSLEQAVEMSLFPMRRAGRDAIRNLVADLVRLPQSTDLYARIASALKHGLGVSGVALYEATSQPELFALAYAEGAVAAPPAVQLPNMHADSSAAPSSQSTDSSLPAENAAPTWEVQIPVRANGTQLGLIAVGPKESGARIDDADLTLLNMVAAQLAIALQNTEYVRQIEIQKAEIEELRKRLEAENVSLRAEVRSVSQFKEIIGVSAALQRALALVEKVAPTNAPIVIVGETGTGKELIARAIHDLSPRCNGPLISVNCPAIPAGLAESELFGHERGAFTDAVQARPGKFELAHGGTIFLDEIADLSLDIQVKLLRVLQEHETQRIGSTRVRKLDLRVVAATNRNLEDEMRAGRFREDLYYRLAAVVVSVPPLRERSGDIPMLASYFLDRAATTYQKPVTGFSPEALTLLGRYNWPGNIRELQHVVERAVLLCASDVVLPEHLGDLAVAEAPQRPLRTALREEKLRRVVHALAQTGGNQAAAARLLGMSANNLARLMKNLGLKAPRAVH